MDMDIERAKEIALGYLENAVDDLVILTPPSHSHAFSIMQASVAVAAAAGEILGRQLGPLPKGKEQELSDEFTGYFREHFLLSAARQKPYPSGRKRKRGE